MKKIENFKNQILKSELMTKMTGGAKTWHSENYYTDNGCCVNSTTSDQFNDCDGDGVWDSGESGSSTTTICQLPIEGSCD